MTPPGGLESLLAAGRFVVTAELTPPLAADAGALVDRAAPLKGRADAVNVTDAAAGRTAMSSLAAAAVLVQAGVEPVLQLTCRDRNRIALAGELIGAGALGIPNILVLHGDDPKGGDQPDAKPVYDLDSRGVIAIARQLRDAGTLPSGRAVTPPPRLFIGAADTPLDPPPDWRPDGLAAKAEAGAHFVQTQFCFDLEIARRYMARLAEAGLTGRLKMILGVGPIASARSARWMDENLHGVCVPESVIDRLERAADPAAEGRKLCVELIQGLSEIPGVAGVHVMAPQQKPAAIAAVIAECGVLNDRAA
jgi:methylenetetrahydrofolate reductase (NADPH)